MSTSYRRQAPAPVSTGGTDGDYDYNALTSIGQVRSASPEEQAYQSAVRREGHPAPTPPSGPSPTPKSSSNAPDSSSVDGSDALLDLEQLEELHQEAEKMKALGNKHMAAQEYTRAYNAYSAALQLSPVGPSSHVFLSNRAAALLSLKRYAAAATDARRAVALAPTFSKAHARLGQSLYFLKDYEGAVVAYEEALHYEPDNAVTQTYLEKAKRKLAKQQEKAILQARGEETSVADESVPFTVANSVATDPNRRSAVVQTGFRGSSRAMTNAVQGKTKPVNEINADRDADNLISPLGNGGANEPEDDPDFEEALRIQQFANKMLQSKRYKDAIEEYSAALFLVPDDPYLSPELHIGRAHALNGARRHESARNDAHLAIKMQPTAEAYSTLAKSLFYMEDYYGSMEAFEQCIDHLPPGETLSMFDRAYLSKAEAAWNEQMRKNPEDARSTVSARSTSVPKLPPPRFVPREVAMNSTPNMPPTPKSWPQQSPLSPSSLMVGEERPVSFISESLGIKLNRGSDGIVRVISVSPNAPGSPIVRDGLIEVGDVVREAAGVDIRRPITNIMWGDTVALIKMAPRPIILVVAQEVSEVPPFVREEIRKAAQQYGHNEEEEKEEVAPAIYFEEPSPANGMESVRDSVVAADAGDRSHTESMGEREVGDGEVNDTVDFGAVEEPSAKSESPLLEEDRSVDMSLADAEKPGPSTDSVIGEDEIKMPLQSENGEDPETATESESMDKVEALRENEDGCEKLDAPKEVAPIAEQLADVEQAADESSEAKGKDECAEEKEVMLESDPKSIEEPVVECDVEMPTEVIPTNESESDFVVVEQSLSPREVEIRRIGGEIVFQSKRDDAASDEWTNLRWLATTGARKVRFCDVVMKLVSERTGIFWNGKQYARRRLAIYDYPNLILVLRPPKNAAEIRTLLDLPDGVEVSEGEGTPNSFFIAESVIDPKTCKLRLSLLTTPTSVESSSAGADDPRRKACIELVTPTETVILSALPPKDDDEGTKPELWSTTSDIYLETAGLESAIANALHHAHMPPDDAERTVAADMAWKHQIVQGSLHSFVVSGNQDMLEKALNAAANTAGGQSSVDGSATKYLRPQVIDERDESGRTALHYACSRRDSVSVAALVGAGANCSIPVGPAEFYPSHLSALVLDEKSLSVILSASYPMRPDPNALDSFGRTPMYLAAVAGRSVGGGSDDTALARCLSALEAWGGQMMIEEFSSSLHHPVSYLASRWRPGAITAVLAHVPYRYPLDTADSDSSKTLSSLFHYPIHASLITLRKKIELMRLGDKGHGLLPNELAPDSVLVGTVKILLENGFEPNERLDTINDTFEGAATMQEYIGYTPLQILAAAALEVDNLPDSIGASVKQTAFLLVARTAELLVRNGARCGLAAPSGTRLSRTTSGGSASVASGEGSPSETTDGSLDRAELKIESNKKLMLLLGGEERLYEAKKTWSMIKSVESAGKFKIHKEKPKSSDDGDGKSCSICWKTFGTLRNRKHRCRITNCIICEDCSSKRLVENGEEFRLSDGQFLLARMDASKAEATRQEEEQERARVHQMRVKKIEDQRAARQKESREAQESDRDTLFGGVMEKAASYVFGEDPEEPKPQEQVNNLSQKMNQTRDALNQRGEKLNSLSEKTSKLKDSSMEFAKLAKELNKAQKGGLFW